MKQYEPAGPYEVTVDDRVATVRISNPDGLLQALESVRSRYGTRAVVIDMTVDLKEFPGNIELVQSLSGFPLPLVVALAGNVRGWAASVLLASNICYADASSVIEFDKDTDLSAYLGKAKQTDSASRVFSAGIAVSLGILNETDEATSALEAAISTANRISLMAPLAVRACLSAVDGAESSLDEGLENEVRLFSALFRSQDFKRGTESFIERSKPSFEGN